MDFSFLERRDGRGEYLWDPFLFLLAGGAIVNLLALVMVLNYFTPPPNGNVDPPIEVYHPR